MIEPPFPLEAWCNERPRTRWTLVALLIVAIWGVAGGVETGALWGTLP